MDVASMKYGEQTKTGYVFEFKGLNHRDRATDGELVEAKNVSTRRYPALAPRASRALQSRYTRPSALFGWDNLVVVDGTKLIYKGETVGTVLAGEKQFAVVNTKLVIWPDMLILDLQSGSLDRMNQSLSLLPDTVTFEAGKLVASSTPPLMGSASEQFTYVVGEQPTTTVFSGLSFADGTWQKTGEAEKAVSELAVGDLMISATSEATGAQTMRTRTGDEEYAEENTAGLFLKVTGVKNTGENECKWEKFSVNTYYSTYYTQGPFDLVSTDTDGPGAGYAGYSGYNFNQYTGQFSPAGSAVTLSAGQSGRIFQTGSGNICKMVTYTAIKNPDGTSTHSICDIHYSYAKGPYTSSSSYKGSTSYGYVYDAEGTYPNNGIKDGYWYVFVEKTGFGGTTEVSYDVFGQGNRKLSDVFEAGGVVEISGCESTENNRSRLQVVSVDDYSATFAEDTFTPGSETGAVTISTVLPNLAYICASNNRLWGVSNDTRNEIWDAEKGEYKVVTSRAIYASALGMPERFWDYEGLDTDSYAVAVGTDGDFTGIVPYSDQVLCWKEDVLHRITGAYPSAYYMYTDHYFGMQAGSHKSAQIINGVLYYKGTDGVYRYSGGQPTLVSYPFGERKFHIAVAGALGYTYYISMRNEDEQPELYTYDTLHGLWSKEDNFQATDFASVGGYLYALGGDSVYIVSNGDERVEWSADLADFGTDSFFNKQYKWLMFDVEIPKDCEFTVAISPDDRGWETVHTETRTGRHVIRIPLRGMRCQRLGVRVSGVGDVILRGVSREYNVCSEEMV